MLKNLAFLFIAALLISACSTHRTVQTSHARIELAARAPETSQPLAAGFTEPQLVASPTLSTPAPELIASTSDQLSNVAKGTQYEEKIAKINQILLKTQQLGVDKQAHKPNLMQKIALKKISKQVAKAQAKIQPTDGKDFNNLDGNLKIGLILLGVALILAIFGLGLVAGIAALIALAFVILGLLNSY